jgi:hypothetical protein
VFLFPSLLQINQWKIWFKDGYIKFFNIFLSEIQGKIGRVDSIFIKIKQKSNIIHISMLQIYTQNCKMGTLEQTIGNYFFCFLGFWGEGWHWGLNSGPCAC